MWKYQTGQPDGAWESASYDDSGWKESVGGFGTRGTPGGVIRTEWNQHDIWLRREFIIPESGTPAAKSRLSLRIHHDEDAEAWLNGVKIADLPRWTQGYIEIPLPPEAVRSLRPGRNVLAIHCHQNNGGQFIDAGIMEAVARQSSATKP